MTNPISPKVFAGAIVTLVLGTLVAALGAVTPGMLAALGPWAPVAFAAITALGAGVSSYVVSDNVRAAGVESLAIHRSIAAAAPVTLTKTPKEPEPVEEGPVAPAPVLANPVPELIPEATPPV